MGELVGEVVVGDVVLLDLGDVVCVLVPVVLRVVVPVVACAWAFRGASSRWLGRLRGCRGIGARRGASGLVRGGCWHPRGITPAGQESSGLFGRHLAMGFQLSCVMVHMQAASLAKIVSLRPVAFCCF